MPPIIKLTDQLDLVETKKFPHAHWKYEKFNPPQSRVFEYYDKDVNGLIAASTSAGKTCIAELFLSYETRVRKKKGLYLVPMRALAQEKIDEWTDENHHFSGLNISICTGDYRLTKERAAELRQADIIIMSTEMLSHRCRNFKAEQNDWLLSVGTCIIDESHLLTVPGRGDHLEVGLMKLTSINPNVKLFMLSATMPNVEEIAEWISYSLTKRETFCLRSTYRPCVLNVHYESYYDGYNRYDDKEMEKVSKAMDIVDYYPNDKFLIFAHTKRTGEMMKDALRADGIKAEFHNASLEKKDRIALENRFRKEKEPRVIVATPTLAWGCCSAGTQVLMADGTHKSIEFIMVGDEVLSKTDDNQFISKKVLRTGPKYVQNAITVCLTTNQKITVSEDHQFWVFPGEYMQVKDFAFSKYGTQSVGFRTSKGDLVYNKVRSIWFDEPQEMYDIEVEDTHNYISEGMISHNCNLPARRVILLGVHRGLDEVETYNITQEIGRSGRVGLDPQGDAYILLPESKMAYYKTKLQTPQKIESQLLSKVGDHHKVLAFHLVSEIHHGEIKTNDGIHSWYKRSLAHFQNKELADGVVDHTMELLRLCGAVKQEDEEWTILPVGQVASMFYFSPFDVSDLRKNFQEMFDANRQDDDYWLSFALGNIDSQRMNIVSKAEKEEMSMYFTKLRQMLGLRYQPWMDPGIKAAFCYFQLLNGNNSSILAATQRNLQFDYERVSQVLIALDSMGCKWGKIKWLKGIEQRIASGVPMYLVDLCRISNIGKVRGKKLYEAGIKTVEDFSNLSIEQAKKLLMNVKTETVQQMLNEASALHLTEIL